MNPTSGCHLLMGMLTGTLVLLAQPHSNDSLALIPAPAHLEIRPGHFELGRETPIFADPASSAEAQTLGERLQQRMGRALSLVTEVPGTAHLDLRMDPGLEPELGKEGYRLRITPTAVEFRAATSSGLFYAGITFEQLLLAGTTSRVPGRLPCLEIIDRPRFVWRGLLLDVARHYQSPEFIRKFIDVMALHKFNSLQLHLTDDQGWRLEIRKHPRLTEIGSIRRESPKPGDRATGDGVPYGPFFYTQQEIRDLVAYAQARHVTLVPEIEMPGHFLAALAAYPRFSCRGGPFHVRTRWGVEPDILCAGNDEAVRFAQEILEEVIEMFPSTFIHIGGDEAPRDRWKECPKCQARMRAEGLENEAQLQTWFNHQIEGFLEARGRRMIGWDEILEGGLTPGAAVMSWRGTEGGLAAAQEGHDVVMSPTSHCYFDYAQSKDPGEPESIGGFIPLETVYAFEPIPTGLPAERHHHILGAQGNLWSEYMWTPRDVEYFAFPRAAALAEGVWSPPEKRNWADFLRRLSVHEKRWDLLRVNYRPLGSSPGR